MDSKSEQMSEIDYRAALRPPPLPSVGSLGFDGLPKRIIPAEPVIDRLWRTLGETARCQWLDRDVQHVTFWFDLEESFGNDYRPEEDGQTFALSLKSPRRSFTLSTNFGDAHTARICFVHKQTLHVRTNLPMQLLELLQQVHEDTKVPKLPLSIVLRRRSSPGRSARRIGTERTFGLVKASGPSMF